MSEDIAGILESEGIGKALLGHDGPYDVERLKEYGYIFYPAKGGVLIAEPITFGEYRVHGGFKSDSRGLNSVVAHRKALHDIFTETDAVRLVCTIDAKNLSSLRNAIMLGFEFYQDIVLIGMLDYMSWAASSRKCRDAGEPFADICGLFLSEKIRCHLGAFVLTVAAGNKEKALHQWLRYAFTCGINSITANEDGSFEFCGKLFKVVEGKVEGV